MELKEHHSIKRRKWVRVTEKEREIEALRKAKQSLIEIAKQMGRGRGTIQRELKRGTVIQRDAQLAEKLAYLGDVGQRKQEER